MTQGDTGAESDSTDASSLSFPDETWSGFLRNHFGPSVLWALLSIGSSHVILAPTVGARYGIFGVWLFVLVYSVKWGGWELGIRYNYGKGKNPVEG
ncbi:MAG: divalent metal cation transporter, partial [Halobacteria archaeon]|nr:divalent metal cation transporter [Halobacteria archaeon]